MSVAPQMSGIIARKRGDVIADLHRVNRIIRSARGKSLRGGDLKRIEKLESDRRRMIHFLKITGGVPPGMTETS